MAEEKAAGFYKINLKEEADEYYKKHGKDMKAMINVQRKKDAQTLLEFFCQHYKQIFKVEYKTSPSDEPILINFLTTFHFDELKPALIHFLNDDNDYYKSRSYCIALLTHNKGQNIQKHVFNGNKAYENRTQPNKKKYKSSGIPKDDPNCGKVWVIGHDRNSMHPIFQECRTPEIAYDKSTWKPMRMKQWLALKPEERQMLAFGYIDKDNLDIMAEYEEARIKHAEQFDTDPL